MKSMRFKNKNKKVRGRSEFVWEFFLCLKVCKNKLEEIAMCRNEVWGGYL